MSRFGKNRWPAEGPVRSLLVYLDELHREAGRPSLTDIGREVALARSTLSGFFSGARLISQGNLELLVEHLGGDVQEAESLRRRAATAWHEGRDARPTRATDVVPVGDGTGRLEILLFDSPTNRLNRPDRLFGREEIAARVHTILDRGGQILLHGMGGSGKTALATAVADERVAAGKGPYLWLRPAQEDAESALDCLARSFANARERELIAATAGDAYLVAIRQVLERLNIRLCVVDDVWHPPVLHAILRAIPDGVGVLVTSRLKLGLEHLCEVAELPAPAAVSLLVQHARRPWIGQAEQLCRDLGYHPYAIEIAGSHLRLYDSRPDELREQLVRAQHDLGMPAAYAGAGRESVKRLLDRTYEALDSTDAQAALQAFGVLFSGTATVELLAIYLGFDLPRMRAALHRLVDFSLARRIPDTSCFEVHELTFAYARMLGGKPGVDAVREFVAAHARDYDLLAMEMDNLLGAAAAARDTDEAAFLAIVETLATEGYLDESGHTLGLLRLLDDAIGVVRNDPQRQHMLLSKSANARYNQGDLANAIQRYRRALDLAPTEHRRVILLSVLGKVLAEVGEHEEADRHFTLANDLAAGDEHARLRVLEQQSVAAFGRQDYRRLKDLTVEGLELSRRLGNRTLEAIFLNNLGTAEFESGVCAAIALHRQAQGIAAELGNGHVLALTHHALGTDFHAQEKFEPAQSHFTSALDLYAKLGQRERLAGLRGSMRRFGYLEGTPT